MYSQIDSNKRKTFILIIIFVSLLALIGYILSYLTDSGYLFLIIAIIAAIAMALGGYFKGDKMALTTAGACSLSRQQSPYLHRIVENLCITAGLPKPKIYLIPDNSINAFATGRDPKHASIAVTKGALDKLENEELEGVIAHELSHIKNYDIRLMTLVIVLVGTVVLISDWFLRIIFFSGRGGGKKGGGNAILLIVGIVLIVLSPIFAQLIKLAISRKREYLADASGSLLTRYPDGLANALEKIKNDPAKMARASQATAHLYIANPLKNSQTKKFFKKAFSTHPPVDERIKQLRKMTA